MSKFKYIIFLSVILTLSACQDWLDVQPMSEVDQDELFASEEGYFDALNGVYLNLGKSALYGNHLTMSTLDVLAQNYFIPTGHSYIDMVYHNYETTFGEQVIASIWKESYNVIANCNNIIDHMDVDVEAKFSDDNYKLIKGEALTIRAYLHFDLLRMFNKAFIRDPEFLGIPFVDEYEIELTEQTTTTETLNLIIKDLTSAYNLLQADAIAGDDETVKGYRENRFNYYAATALLARVYLYMNDYSNAERYAQEVIDSERFEWMNPANILADNDYVFYPELVMGLYSTQIGKTARGMFKFTENDNPNELVCANRTSDWYDGDDIRYKYWFETESTLEGDKRFMIKYNRPTDEDEEKYYQDPVLPLIKLSEMYLIVAECQAKNNLAEGISTLNQMRSQRRAVLLDEAADEMAFAQALTAEYEREFYGEGQLFYYYKRLNFIEIIGMDGTPQPMNAEKYTFPFPADEIQYGGRVTE